MTNQPCSIWLRLLSWTLPSIGHTGFPDFINTRRYLQFPDFRKMSHKNVMSLFSTRFRLEILSASMLWLTCTEIVFYPLKTTFHSQELNNLDFTRRCIEPNEHRFSQGRMSSKFLSYLVILCFEKRCPEKKFCCSPEAFYPPKFWTGYVAAAADVSSSAFEISTNEQWPLYIVWTKALVYRLMGPWPHAAIVSKRSRRWSADLI